ncbi:hypothetical protein WJ41_35140 [Burkholderia ubonensis]|uniref:hypothetical protein n=1 Tax=Burkholderia ubonensis TaxID=101571 RepID=UPI000754AFBB|nr:hypothetical protein [Burkholderia ubonensis]KVH78747.1 hypothetical protein WJ41_35140 [Burkholderia ubonensis]KVT98638.1 hypothetical protein WK61_09415 [Burkholderia ubonensis]
MTRDEINVAVNKAFDANVWAVVGSWTINIETAPARQLVLADALVEQLLSGAIGPTDFDAMLSNARDAAWTPNKDGSLIYLLNC